MARKKRRKPAQGKTAQPLPPAEAAKPQEQPAQRRYAWIPPWGWALIFALPLIASEYMFYVVGHWGSMILFPVAWIGFWAMMMWRMDWALFKRRRKA